MKRCPRCKTEKAGEEWGKAPYCKPCWREYCAAQRAKNPDANRRAALAWYYRNREHSIGAAKAWNSANPDKVRENQKRWYGKNGREYYEKNREKRREQGRKYARAEQLNDPERVRARRRKFYVDNVDKIRTRRSQKWHSNVEESRAKQRAKYQANREIFITASMRTKARRRRAAGSHTTKEWLELLSRHEFRCAYCPAVLTRATAQRDHIVALARGGTNDISNIVPACTSCNNRKRCRSAEDFRKAQQG